MAALTAAVVLVAAPLVATASGLRAGVAKVDITNEKARPVNDRLYAKALVLRNDETTVVLITVDAVAIGEIGYIGNDYLPKVRSWIKKELSVPPSNVVVNASHCHGIVCKDVAERTIRAVKAASQNLVPVKVGAGRGQEDRIMENRRLRLKNGRELDVRHAYSMPPDQEVAGVGPVDPEIGVLRLDRLDGRPLAVVYNFACHPIQGVPSGGNTADIVGFASRVIEENLNEDAMAFFLQGCAGDINPVFYKAVDRPRDAEPLGNLLGLSTLRAARKIACKEDSRLIALNETLALPQADYASQIAELEKERTRLVESLAGTTLNLKTFLPLVVKYRLFPEYPSYYSHRYLWEKQLGREHLRRLDAENRRNIERYVRNIYAMEQITRINTNLRLLRKHQTEAAASGKKTIDVELVAVRVGDFVLLTFPGELTVQIGLNIKKKSPHRFTFVAGYTNGYIYYAPTAEQLRNRGGAQEDSDCLLAPEWQALFEAKALDMLKRL
ncbi:MAG: hypothetical protein GXP27_17175 [Planctomycetes bacterium]|nr:hypothetical protein [Planctomycetota bacterium]